MVFNTHIPKSKILPSDKHMQLILAEFSEFLFESFALYGSLKVRWGFKINGLNFLQVIFFGCLFQFTVSAHDTDCYFLVSYNEILFFCIK